MDGKPQLYRVDDIRVGDLLFTDNAARDEGHDELCSCDYGQHRSSSIVRDHSHALLF